jgi:hypothetical protein
LLEGEPGVGGAAISRAMNARAGTTGERLKRMKAKCLIIGGGHAGWTAAV